LIIGREEFHHLIAHFGDGGDRAGEVFGQRAAHRIEFQAYWNVFVRGGQGQRRSGAGRDKRSSGNAMW
jgi:hypothetical protein